MTLPAFPFFVLSCARSGSTSLAKILGSAPNCTCLVEPMPNLNREARDIMDGRRSDAADIIREQVAPRVAANSAAGKVYGEKNVTYGPFIPELHAQLGARFVFLVRDGRDVVTSLINWHEQKFGNVYRECRETGAVSQEAIRSASALPVHLDSSDCSRPRPGPEEPVYHRWESLTRLEMCAWYWQRINRLYRDNLSRLSPDCWRRIDYTAPSAQDILRLAEFLGVVGLREEDVARQLAGKINSLKDRFGKSGTFPQWVNWSSAQRRQFDGIAGDAMKELGCWANWGIRYRPPGYGDWWRNHKGGIEWYSWMYNSRRMVHEQFVGWVRGRDRAGDRLEAIMDAGCGMGVGYAEQLADRRYTGVDLGPANVEWCRTHRSNPLHDYVCADLLEQPLERQFDVVFSSGTADNSYDLEAFLGALVAHSRKWIYVTLYRGWFPDLDDHEYSWDPATTCYYVDAAPGRIRSLLEGLGCRDIEIGPVPTDNREIRMETRIIARVPPCVDPAGGGG